MLEKLKITKDLVSRLIASQFPQWKDLSIEQVLPGGWDNRIFRLGKNMLVRLPSSADYADKVKKEQYWLPKLAPLLPIAIPEPMAMGNPELGYPFHWSVYKWLEGETLANYENIDQINLANDLADFLISLHSIDTTGGPEAGKHNFYRGGSLSIYDSETRQAIKLLNGKIDNDIATKIWNDALKTTWNKPSVWVHGDISAGNLLVQNGQLSAVIDFGGLAIGDPACDLAIAWTFFNNDARSIFKNKLQLDEATWSRGRAWALWKALIVSAELTDTNIVEKKHSWNTISEIINDYRKSC